MRLRKCGGCRKTNCNGCSLHPGKVIDSVKNHPGGFPALFQPEKKSGWGIVFDIGTTTVAATLWDLEQAVMLGAQTRANPQRVAGSDVASRIAYCLETGTNLSKLQALLVEAMEEMAKQLLEEHCDGGKCGQDQIKEAVVIGNTAMCEILLGISVEGLSHAPFLKGYEENVSLSGRTLGFEILADTVITVLAPIGGYVGADALCVYHYIQETDGRKQVLAVDIGTNGEMILFGKERDYVCSAAAGPALEGAAILQGMSAAPGAIEAVGLMGSFPREDIYCKVIGDAQPVGICGSGLIDVLALLRKLEIVDATGYLRSCKEAQAVGVPERICRRIQTVAGENRILLTTEDAPVYLTAKDIRQLQLAKAAIRGAIQVLLDKEGISADELVAIYLAGAFGSYIRAESAERIGLLPDKVTDSVKVVGNCAMMGGAMALFSEDTKRKMEQNAKAVCHIELAGDASFQEYFVEYMGL